MRIKTDLKRVWRTLVVFIFYSIYSTGAQAGDILDAFEYLKDSGVHIENNGEICEKIAKHNFELRYDSKMYRIESNISYSSLSAPKQIKGELDLMVVRKGDEQAILIAEVKCWRDLHEARLKAEDQRQRFRQYQFKGLKLYHINHEGGRRKLESCPVHFDLNPDFVLISQDEADHQGFDETLGYTLGEISSLRTMLAECQNLGRCPKFGFLPDHFFRE